jgi:cytochrome oxidase assembly protein ShyY1
MSPLSTYRFLLSPRWVGLTVLVIVLIPLFLLASSWQFDRLAQKRERNTTIAAALDAPIVSFSDAIVTSSASGPRVQEAQRWRGVRIDAEIVPGRDVLIRRKFLDNNPGYWVVSPALSSQGVVVPIIRGWVPNGPNALTPPPIAAPALAPVQLTARLMPSEQRRGARPSDLPADQWDRLIPREFGWDDLGTVLDGALEATTSVPTFSDGIAPTPLPQPEMTEGPHLSYAWQWRIFVLLALVGWVVLVRANASRDNDEASAHLQDSAESVR